jgi:hypothetical protein
MAFLGWAQRVSSKLRNIGRMPEEIRELNVRISELNDLVHLSQAKQLQLQHANPLNRFGTKAFSQSDEDGITLEILGRIGALESGVFAEFGVGDGTENNTLILAALGWKGFWVSGEDLKFELEARSRRRFSYLRDWITLENIEALARRGLSEINATSLDLISLDLDGNDIYFVEKILASGLRPRVFIVEYNGMFPPPVKFQIAYDPSHRWAGDDYFGASLASFLELFERFSYRLVCCNSQAGTNAFFVDSIHAEAFSDVPNDIRQIFVEPRYFGYPTLRHRKSLRTISSILNGE